MSALLPTIPLDQLALMLAVTLLLSALGFLRVDYFVSLGYAFSIAALALLLPALHAGRLDPWLLAQAGLLLLYGLRLGSFLLRRERSPSFAVEFEASKARSARVRGVYRLVIWVAVAVLYVLMAAPLALTLATPAGTLVWSLPPGLLLMAAGLAIEALADRQKSALKAVAPRRFVDRGLFRMVRYPNYFGEMLFWLGGFVAGLAAYRSPGDWLLALAGLLAIELVMLGSARRLELKQAERYGADPEFVAYAGAVPVLIPLLPLYSLQRLRIYLG